MDAITSNPRLNGLSDIEDSFASKTRYYIEDLYTARKDLGDQNGREKLLQVSLPRPAKLKSTGSLEYTPNSPNNIKSEVFKLSEEEKLVLARKEALEVKHRRLLEEKAVLESLAKKEELEREKKRTIHNDIRALEMLASKVPLAKNLATEIVLASQVESSLTNLNEREAAGLLTLARRRQIKRENYINLASLLTFFALYSILLLIQRDQTAAFHVESR